MVMKGKVGSAFPAEGHLPGPVAVGGGHSLVPGGRPCRPAATVKAAAFHPHHQLQSCGKREKNFSKKINSTLE
jgi:hypothetical protein